MAYQEEYETGIEYASEPEAAIQINKELALARRIVEQTGTNLFLTGKAGTGKTTFLRRLREESGKRMVVLAPTGVAAINAGGMTIHSFFQLPLSPYLPGRGFVGEERHFMRVSKEKRKLIASLDLIVIDEISMVRPDTLDGIDSILRRMRGVDAPFGGVQLLLIGDLRQLAPVVRSDEWDMLRSYYASQYFFESHSLKQAGFISIELKHIYRQQDQEFIGLLNAVRNGNADANVLLRLNAQFRPRHKDLPDNVIRLTTHNRTSDEINARHLAALDSPAVIFEATITGKFPESSYPADKFLALKIGARVMFIKNDTRPERKYYNGLIGTVIDMDTDSVIVKPDDSALSPIKAENVEWENTAYSINESTKEISQYIEGTFSQIPLRPAWAITIHKSQGLTFDNAIIDACRSFAPGQLYVALSRCRSLEGLFLDSPLSQSAVIVDRVVNSFIDESERNMPDDAMIDKLRDEYYRNILADLFNFRPLTAAFADFKRAVEEYVAPMHPELYDKYNEASKLLGEKIDSVGQKFISLYASNPINSVEMTSNKTFMEKIHNGCRYFLEQLAPICCLLNETPLELDNSSMLRRLENVTERLMLEMSLKKTILSGMLDDVFSPESYMKYKAQAVLSVEEKKFFAKGVKKANKKKDKEKKKKKSLPKGYSQRISLNMWREGKDIETIARERELKPTTIAMHLVDMVKIGQLKEEDILHADTKDKIKSILDKVNASGENADNSARFKIAEEAGIPPLIFSIYRQFYPL